MASFQLNKSKRRSKRQFCDRLPDRYPTNMYDWFGQRHFRMAFRHIWNAQCRTDGNYRRVACWTLEQRAWILKNKHVMNKNQNHHPHGIIQSNMYSCLRVWTWIVVGVILSAIIQTAIPTDWFAGLRFVGSAVALAVSIPSAWKWPVPIAVSLVASGFPTGAALVFSYGDQPQMSRQLSSVKHLGQQTPLSQLT